MIEEDFYASIKLKSGEEIFAKVIPTQENKEMLLLVHNPIVINKFKSRTGVEGFKIEPWLKTTTEDLFILNMKDVLTISETKDIEMIILHQQFSNYKDNNTLKYNNHSKRKMSRKMGYISNISDAKKLLENIYKNS